MTQVVPIFLTILELKFQMVTHKAAAIFFQLINIGAFRQSKLAVHVFTDLIKVKRLIIQSVLSKKIVLRGFSSAFIIFNIEKLILHFNGLCKYTSKYEKNTRTN